MQLLAVIASMIAQAVRLRQSAHEERQRLMEENSRLLSALQERFRPSNIIGNSNAMQEVYSLIGQVCRSDTTVLIRGESGTGKELVAHAIHYNSPRADKPFIKVHCAALPSRSWRASCSATSAAPLRGPSPPARPLRAGQRRLDLSRRDRRAEPGDAGQAAARPPGAGDRAGRGTQVIKVNVRLITATNRNLEE